MSENTSVATPEQDGNRQQQAANEKASHEKELRPALHVVTARGSACAPPAFSTAARVNGSGKYTPSARCSRRLP